MEPISKFNFKSIMPSIFLTQFIKFSKSKVLSISLIFGSILILILPFVCETLVKNFDKAKDFCASSYDKTKNFLNEKLKNDEKSDSQAEKYDKDAKQKDEIKEEKTIKKEVKKKRSSGTQKKEVE